MEIPELREELGKTIELEQTIPMHPFRIGYAVTVQGVIEGIARQPPKIGIATHQTPQPGVLELLGSPPVLDWRATTRAKQLQLG